MAMIRPFRGCLFRDPASGSGDPCAAPPYDVIHGDERERFAALSPANVVHLTLPEADGAMNPYEAAAARLRAMLADGRLRRDETPTVYLQDARFPAPDGTERARKGFLALAKVEPIGTGSILGHEEVLAKPLQDRARLLAATRANLEPVFLLYSDPEGRVDALLDPFRASAPLARARLDDATHELRRASADAAGAVATLLAGHPLYIADGHHRFTVSSRFLDEHGEIEGARWRLALFVRAEDAGLVILPTHRFVDGLPAAADQELRVRLDRHFTKRAVDPSRLPEATQAAGGGAIGVWQRKTDEAFVARPNPEVAHALRELPPPLDALDVNVLHRFLLRPPLGGGEITCRYVRGEEDPVGLAAKENVALAFFLGTPRVETVLEVSDLRRTMPPKSTYFFPKAASGQVLYRFADAPEP